MYVIIWFSVYTCKRVWICFFFAPDPMAIFRTETIRRRYVGTQKKNVSAFTPANVNKNSNNIYIPIYLYYTRGIGYL